LGPLLEEWEQVRYKEDLNRMRVGIERKKGKVLTIRRYTVIFGLVIFGTAVRCRLEMVGAEGICAVLTFEWQKVYEKAGRV
jgi:hypothetical protein